MRPFDICVGCVVVGLGFFSLCARLTAAVSVSTVGVALADANVGAVSEKVLERPKANRGAGCLVSDPLQPKTLVYRKTPEGELATYVFYPADWRADDRRPALAFFFGGGWKNGSPGHFFPQAEYFASRGLVCLLFEYRIRSIHGTTPDVCVVDAKAALRWIRKQAATLGIDPGRVVASGGSSGAHLALATATLEGFDDASREESLSCRPDALILFNPVVDLRALDMRDATGKPIGGELSPALTLKAGAPPMLFFYGTEDKLFSQGADYFTKSAALGNHCQMFVARGGKHGFFNELPWMKSTAIEADRFLCALGYLSGASPLASPTTGLLERWSSANVVEVKGTLK